MAEAYLSGKRNGLIRPVRLFIILSLPAFFLINRSPILVFLGSMAGIAFNIGYWSLAARKVYGEGRGMTLLKVGVLQIVVMAYGIVSMVISLLIALPFLQAR